MTLAASATSPCPANNHVIGLCCLPAARYAHDEKKIGAWGKIKSRTSQHARDSATISSSALLSLGRIEKEKYFGWLKENN
jgi:hypothetical protein